MLLLYEQALTFRDMINALLWLLILPVFFWIPTPQTPAKMSRMDKGGSQQTSLLDVLKKKMRQAREEAEQAKDEADEVKRQLGCVLC